MNKVKEGTVADFFKTLFGNNDYSVNEEGLNEEEAKMLKQLQNSSKKVEIELENKYSGTPIAPKGGKSRKKSELEVNTKTSNTKIKTNESREVERERD